MIYRFALYRLLGSTSPLRLLPRSLFRPAVDHMTMQGGDPASSPSPPRLPMGGGGGADGGNGGGAGHSCICPCSLDTSSSSLFTRSRRTSTSSRASSPSRLSFGSSSLSSLSSGSSGVFCPCPPCPPSPPCPPTLATREGLWRIDGVPITVNSNTFSRQCWMNDVVTSTGSTTVWCHCGLAVAPVLSIRWCNTYHGETNHVQGRERERERESKW